LLKAGVRLRAYRMGRKKLVDAEPGGTFFFDLKDDPGEQDDVAMTERLTVATLRESLEAWRERLHLPDLRAAVGAPPAAAMDPAQRERLRQLGYVE
jgi:hypothetical protein